MESGYTDETINAIKKERESKRITTEMNNYVAFEKQRLDLKQKRIEESLKNKRIKRAIVTLMLVTGITAGAAYGINEAVDVLDYNDNHPKVEQEQTQDNYDKFLEYNQELKEKYPDAPDAYSAPTEENYKLFLESEASSKGGR